VPVGWDSACGTVKTEGRRTMPQLVLDNLCNGSQSTSKYAKKRKISQHEYASCNLHGLRGSSSFADRLLQVCGSVAGQAILPSPVRRGTAGRRCLATTSETIEYS
jgi:hypothetical protein